MTEIDHGVSDAVDWDHEEAVGGVYDAVDEGVDAAVGLAIDLTEVRAVLRAVGGAARSGGVR